MKQVAIILNGISLRKKWFYNHVVPALSTRFQVEVFETRTKGDAIGLASKAVEKQYDFLLAAGGDGTLNQVLNGALRNREGAASLPVLGVIPIGSGNDFASTMKVTTDALVLRDKLINNQVQMVDVGKVWYRQEDQQSGVAYFLNVVDAGMGPEVVSRMTQGDRLFSSGFAYYWAILSTFFSYKPMKVKIKTADWAWEDKLRTVAIANGKFYGHGLCIAPGAHPADGLFSSFVCGDVSVLEFIRYTGHLKNEKVIDHPKVVYSTLTHVELTSEEPCRIEADGELLGFLPATVKILPTQIKFLC